MGKIARIKYVHIIVWAKIMATVIKENVIVKTDSQDRFVILKFVPIPVRIMADASKENAFVKKVLEESIALCLNVPMTAPAKESVLERQNTNAPVMRIILELIVPKLNVLIIVRVKSMEYATIPQGFVIVRQDLPERTVLRGDVRRIATITANALMANAIV